MSTQESLNIWSGECFHWEQDLESCLLNGTYQYIFILTFTFPSDSISARWFSSFHCCSTVTASWQFDQQGNIDHSSGGPGMLPAGLLRCGACPRLKVSHVSKHHNSSVGRHALWDGEFSGLREQCVTLLWWLNFIGWITHFYCSWDEVFYGSGMINRVWSV